MRRAHAVDDRGVALEADLRAHAPHLQHVHEAVLEDRLDDRADAVGDRVQRGELRLHVGREGRVRRGAHIDGARPAAAHVDLDPVVAAVARVAPASRSLTSTASRCSGRRVLDAHVAAGDGAGDQVGAALDAVGQHLVVHAVQALARRR